MATALGHTDGDMALLHVSTHSLIVGVIIVLEQFEVIPTQDLPLDVDAGTKGARVWAQTGCSFDGSGHGRCQTGYCGGLLGAPQTPLPNLLLTNIKT
ncbi:protein p21 [Quercus suber]|uniref:Protein p21 n=1 Tax=Quercus suber TaxID=58331 RepID=A0AAW0JVZ1_QUESU